MSRQLQGKELPLTGKFNYRIVSGVAIVNLLLAFVAFGKDLLFASYFGTTLSADTVNKAFLFPEAIGFNLVAAVLGIACVPHLSRLWAGKKIESFIKTVLLASIWAVVAMAGVAFLLSLAYYYGTGWIRFDNDFSQKNLAFLLLPALLVFPLASIGSAALQATGSFYLPAFGPVVMNGCMLGVIALSRMADLNLMLGAKIYAYSILAGAFFMTLIILMALVSKIKTAGVTFGRMKDIFPCLFKNSFSGETAGVYKDFLPILLVMMITQAVYAFERLLASTLGTGYLTGFQYAYRVAQAPNWIFVAAVTAVVLPTLSRTAGAGLEETDAVRKELFRAVKSVAILIIPIGIVIHAAPEPIVSLLFGRGAFDRQSAAVTAQLLNGYSLSVAGQALSAIILRYCLANGTMWRTAAVYFFSSLIIVAFDSVTVYRFGPVSLGYGAFIGWTVNAVVMIVFAVKDTKSRRGYRC